MNEVEFRAELNRRISVAGGVNALARQIGISPEYVSQCRLGRKPPGPALLKAMKIKRIIMYEPVEKG